MLLYKSSVLKNCYESFAFCLKLEAIKEWKQIRMQDLQNLLRLALMTWVLCNEIVGRIFLYLVATSVAVSSSLVQPLIICGAQQVQTQFSVLRPWPGYHHTLVLFPWAIATCWHLLQVHCWPLFCSSKVWGHEIFWLVSPACFVCEADTAGLWRTRPPCILNLFWAVETLLLGLRWDGRFSP